MGSTHSSDLTADSAGSADRVQGTAIDFGEFQVHKYCRDKQTILKFSGNAGAGLGREFERLAAQCRGDVGIDFSDLQGFTPALVPVLERVRKRLVSLKRSLILCNPPSKLVDALTLGNVLSMYSLVDSEGSVLAARSQTSSADKAPRGNERRKTPGAEPDAGPDPAEKEIAYFDRSLKRNEVLERGLDSAARCVEKLLPRNPPQVAGYRFAFTYRQSEKIGGDFFDFIPLEGGKLGLSIGDVSGRGLEAAILMCLAKKVIALRALDRVEKGPSMPCEVLSRANGDLRGDLGRTAFITALYAVLDPEAGLLRFARAGHERPIVVSPAAQGVGPRFLSSEGVAIGVLAGQQFRSNLQEYLVELPPGARLLLYTDGLIDVQNPRGQAFSRPRLLDCMRKVRPTESPAEILTSIFDTIYRHAGDNPADDDMTAIVISRD